MSASALLIDNSGGQESVGLEKRVPRFDIWLYEEEHCQQGGRGTVCEGYQADQCCRMGGNDLVSSADYTEPGKSTRLSDHEIKGYTRLGTDNCGLQITKDPKCADAGYLRMTGAKVFAGSETPTNNKKRDPSTNQKRTVSANARLYFYREGNEVWTIPVNSETGEQYAKTKKSEQIKFLQQKGTKRTLQ
ncbi:MAG: hypothetical protein M1821_002477 [Bathelium mastoideum]|nr:MAG: hypothetical protein M1821_002477 [Bathelium mastoideum]